jgi:hypothetical protein
MGSITQCFGRPQHSDAIDFPKSSIVRALGCVLLTVLAVVWGGCRAGSDSETPPPAKTLVLEHLATILDYGWAWGSEAKVAFDGSTMFVPNGYRGISIYGLGDPGHPEHLARVDSAALGGQGGAVAAAGGRAFVAVPDSDMIVELDVSIPSSPVVVSRFGGIPEYDQLALRGRYLFVQSGSCVDYKGGAYVFDIFQSPPALVGKYLADLIDPGFYVTDAGWVFQARTPAFANDMARIDIVDMAAPSNPLLLSTWSSWKGLNVTDIDVQQGRAYCAAYWGGIFVLGGVDLAWLKLEAEFDWNEEHSIALSAAAAPPYLFVARGDSEGAAESFQAFRHEGGSLTLAWERAAEYPVHSVAVSGNLLVTVEQEPPDTDWPKKILKLYRIFAE